MSQPIFVVAKSALVKVTEHAQKRYRHDFHWGYHAVEEVVGVLSSLTERLPGKIDCALAAERLQALHTCKMVGGANAGLIAVVKRMKNCRQAVKPDADTR